MYSTGIKHGLRINTAILLVLLICLFLPCTAFAQDTLQIINFNQPTSTLKQPITAAKSTNGNLYVCDVGYKHIAVLTAKGIPLFTFNEALSMPIDIAVTADHAFVLDETLHAVLVYSLNGDYVTTIGTQGIAAGQFYNPKAIALNDGELYVADSGNHRIQVFSAQTFVLNRIFAIDENGTDLNAPTSLAVHDNMLYVIEENGTKINTYHKQTGAQMAISLTQSAMRDIDIVALSSGLAVSSPNTKQIIYYDFNLTPTHITDLSDRVYQLSQDVNDDLFACSSTSRTGAGYLYSVMQDGTVQPVSQQDSGFKTISSFAKDDGSNVYVADLGNARVDFFDASLDLEANLLQARQPMDMSSFNGLTYVLDAFSSTVFVYNNKGEHVNSLLVSFVSNPHHIAVINGSQFLVCGSADLYLITHNASGISYQSLSRDLINTPLDVDVRGDRIYLLNSRNGDMLVLSLDGNSVFSVSASTLNVHPSNAVSIAVMPDGTMTLADNSESALYTYSADFNYIDQLATKPYGLENPSNLFVDGNTLYICFGQHSKIAKRVATVKEGSCTITIDGKPLKGFDLAKSTYSLRFNADDTYADISYLADQNYAVRGDLGWYLLDYGLNTFWFTINDGKQEKDYQLFITRALPEGLDLSPDVFDAFIAYQAESTKPAVSPPPNPAPLTPIEKTMILDISNLNINDLDILSLSKQAKIAVKDSKIYITLGAGDKDEIPTVIVGLKDDLVTLSSQALNSLIKKLRNQYILYAVFAGIGVILLVYFFLNFLKNHPGKRNYKKVK